MLDISDFRKDRCNDLEKIFESQRRRFSDVQIVDEIILFDKEWRQRQFELDNLRKELNKASKKFGQLKEKKKKDTTEVMEEIKEIKKSIANKEVEVVEAKSALDSRLITVGNLVHDSVPVSDNEDNNEVIRQVGERRVEDKLKNHVDLVEQTGIADLKRGAAIAGGRGYFLKDLGERLNLALFTFARDFLRMRGYKSLRPPCFMEKEVMKKCAQLSQFDEELYKVEGDDKYFIATAEQPLCAYHMNEWIHPTQLPISYAGKSLCFLRKEAGSHGRYTLGIFRVHQFEKVEQFCITSPNGNDSWDMHEEMLKNSEDFYQASNEKVKQYVHMPNSTLKAIERTICCILESYQKEDGVEIPEVLRPYKCGESFIPFQTHRTNFATPTRGRE